MIPLRTLFPRSLVAAMALVAVTGGVIALTNVGGWRAHVWTRLLRVNNAPVSCRVRRISSYAPPGLRFQCSQRLLPAQMACSGAKRQCVRRRIGGRADCPAGGSSMSDGRTLHLRRWVAVAFRSRFVMTTCMLAYQRGRAISLRHGHFKTAGRPSTFSTFLVVVTMVTGPDLLPSAPTSSDCLCRLDQNERLD